MTDEEKNQLGAVLEIVQSMQKIMATKDDLKSFATKDDVAAILEDIEFIKDSMATKEDLAAVKSELITHIDGFAQQNQKFDHELVAARSQCNRIEERVEVLELKAGIGA